MDPSLRPLLLLDNKDGDETRRKADGSHIQQASPQSYDWLGRPSSSSPSSSPIATSPQSKSSLGGHRTLYFTLGTVCLWYTGYFGLFFNLVLFLRNVVGEGSGAAANNTNNWLGTMFLSSLLGAFVAESYLGRLWACTLFQFIALAGMASTALATSILVSGGSSSRVEVVFFYISLYLVSIGCGGFQPNLQSLGADQFDTEGEKTTFFTRYHVLIHLGSALGDTVMVYMVTAQGWVFGFCMCTIVGVMGLTLFLCGFPLFRQYKNQGNPYTRALQVIVAAARKWHLEPPSDSSLLYAGPAADEEEEEEQKEHNRRKHTNDFRWLDKAAILEKPAAAAATRSDAMKKDGWRLSSVREVEEMKAVLRLVPVWAASIFFSSCYSQAGTLLIEEGATMDTRAFFFSWSMEPATMNLFDILTVVLFPPVYNAVVAPLARRFTGLPRGLSPLQRIAAGYVLCIVSLSLAAILERVRMRRAASGLPAPSIFWQAPEFVLLGTAQFLAGIGQLEFFYTHSPLSLRSLGSAFSLTCTAFGTYVSSFLVTLVTLLTTLGGGEGWIASSDLNDGHLDYFFWLMASLAFLNLLFFLACARSFTKRIS